MVDYLYPKSQPFDEGFLDVGFGHKIHWERRGKRGGLPVFEFHGGPGYGITEIGPRCYNPDVFDIFAFSQPGTGRSTPNVARFANTLDFIVEVTEKARVAMQKRGMKSNKIYIGGGSYGAKAALAYGAKYGQNVEEAILRGTFVTDTKGAQYLFAPDRWEFDKGDARKPYDDFLAAIPEEERRTLFDLAHACSARLFGPDEAEALKIARLFEVQNRWKSTFIPNMDLIGQAASDDPQNKAFVLTLVRTFFHYVTSNQFPESVRADMIAEAKNCNFPVTIIHGEQDNVCPLEFAEEIYAAFPNVRSLTTVSQCGHSMAEPDLQRLYVETTDGWVRNEIGAPAPVSLLRRFEPAS